jgi:hypothetical protein
MAKYNEDAVKLLEQVLPFFNPDYTSTVRMIPELEPLDIPLILNNVSSEDIYEGGFETRRAIVYQLDFTMKGWFFGPEKDKKVIKFMDMRLATDTPTDTEFEEFQTVQPGVDANSAPTTDASISIDYSLIDFDDNWDYAETISDTAPS